MLLFRRKHIRKLRKSLRFYSKRYKKWVTAKKNFFYDGATVVPDLDDLDGALHDWCFFVAYWDEGTPMTFEEANYVYVEWLQLRAEEARGLWERFKYKTCSYTRRALHVVGRKAWSDHRKREMVFHNMKFVLEVKNG